MTTLEPVRAANKVVLPTTTTNFLMCMEFYTQSVSVF